MTDAEPIVVRGLPGHVYAAGRLSTRARPLHLASCWCWHTPPATTSAVAEMFRRWWRR